MKYLVIFEFFISVIWYNWLFFMKYSYPIHGSLLQWKTNLTKRENGSDPCIRTKVSTPWHYTIYQAFIPNLKLLLCQEIFRTWTKLNYFSKVQKYCQAQFQLASSSPIWTEICIISDIYLPHPHPTHPQDSSEQTKVSQLAS